MKNLALCLLYFLCVALVANAEEVVTLTEENFQSTIDENEFVLVEFYAPWCGHCKALAPEYEKAATALKDVEPNVVIAKVDATAEESLAKEFQIQGFPTLKWFVNGKASEYGGGRVEAEIVQWVKKKTGPPAKTLEDAAAVDEFKNEGDVVVVGVFKDQDQAKAFLEAAQGDDNTAYGIAYDSEVVETATGTKAPGIVLFRNFEEPSVNYEGDLSSSEDIAKFVAGNSLPLVVPFSQETAPKIFGGEITVHVLIFIDSSKAEEMDKILNDAKEAAKKKKGEVLFVSVEKSEDRILEFFGITTKDVPTARIVDTGAEGMKKYKYEAEEITGAQLIQFIEDFQEGKLKPDLKSEDPLDESEQGDVYVIVGKNFDEVVKRPGVNVLVEFYAPWCGHCKKLEPEYKELGEHYKDHENVLIAKMDATANEVEAVTITGFPTIKLFPADSDEIIDFDGERTKEGMVKFLDKYLSN